MINYGNPPMLIRTINDRRWNDGLNLMTELNSDRLVVETHGIWEYILERDEINPLVVYQNTYRNGILVDRNPVYIREVEA